VLRQGKVGSFAIYEEREGGHRGAVHNGALKPGTAWLRLERRGNQILGAVSNNGRDWAELKPIDTLWPGKLKVGLVAINSNSEPLTVRFKDYKLKTP
jgi:regulation of enolase protein 1 (concanavalin A-like superfamily)